MIRRISFLAAVLAAFLVVSVVPAYADDEPEEVETEEVEAEEDGEPGAGALWKINLLTAEFGDEGEGDTTGDDILALLEDGVGFGHIYKLYYFANAFGDLEAFGAALAEFCDEATGECEWGELKNSLTDEQLALLEGLPKNLGQLIAAHKRPEHAGQKGKPAHAGEKGKPAHAGKDA